MLQLCSFQSRLTRLLSLCLLVLATASIGSAQCTPGATDRTVRICTPTSSATVSSPVRVTAAARDNNNVVAAMQIYLDGTKVYQNASSTLDTSVSMSSGSHRITVKAWDKLGSFSQSITVTASSGGSACTLNPTNRTVTICTPSNGATVNSPVRIAAGATDSNTVSAMQIYADGVKVYQAASKNIDTSISLSAGSHRLTVKAWDSLGSFSQSITVSVGSTQPPPSTGGLSNLRHIIFFVQENRSFDNYFGRLGQYRKDRGLPDNVDDLPLDVALLDRNGIPVKPYKLQTVCHDNLSPSWQAQHEAWNNGKMDQFLKVASKYVPATTNDPDGTRAIGYYDWNDLPYYYELATQFATSDRFFASVMANTIPNRMYLFTGTSFGHVHPDPAPAGGWKQKTIFDVLTQNGISWRYYYQDNSLYLSEFDTWNRDSGKTYPISYWYADVQNESTLPQVIFIERHSTGFDEHPGDNIQKGAARTKQILDALMQSPSWASSAFILTYDEGGGLYDHVPPVTVAKPDNIAPLLGPNDPPGDFTLTATRVPLMVVSPWVKPHYVSHTPMELTSILKLIEKRFNLPPLTQRDANAPDMTEFFDFTQPHWLTPPPLPAQPTNGLCSFAAEAAPGH